jgi:hypothetical protein
MAKILISLLFTSLTLPVIAETFKDRDSWRYGRRH